MYVGPRRLFPFLVNGRDALGKFSGYENAQEREADRYTPLKLTFEAVECGEFKSPAICHVHRSFLGLPTAESRKPLASTAVIAATIMELVTLPRCEWG